MDMDQRESTDGCLNYGVPNDGFSNIYVGDIEIRSEMFYARKISRDHKYEEIVAANEEPRSTSPC